MEQPFSLQRLCIITLGSATWDILHLILRIRELFPSTQSAIRINTKTIYQKNSKLIHGLAPARVEENDQELRERFDEIREVLYEKTGGPQLNELLAINEACSSRAICFGRIFEQDKDRYKEFQAIYPYVKLHIKKIVAHLPLSLQTSCKEIIMDMGEKIYHWHEYISVNLKINVAVPDKFYWTPIGNLDENRYLEKWEQDDDFSRKISYSFGAPVLYVLACVYVREDYIKSHQDEMENLVKMGLRNFKLENYDDKVYTLIALYLNFHIIQEAAIGINDLNESGYVITPDKMLEMSIRASYHKLVYYFWSKLNDFGYDEQYLMKITRDSLEMLKRYNNTHSFYSREKAGEITNFLINQMLFSDRDHFIQQNAKELFCKFLPLWPFIDIASKIFDDYFSKLSQSDYSHIVVYIQKLIQETINQGGPEIKIDYFRQFFARIFRSFSQNLKRNIFDLKFIKRNFLVFDIKCLKLVLSDVDESLRSNMIAVIKLQTVRIVADGNRKRMNEIVDEILISDEEKNDFRNYIFEAVSRTWANEKFYIKDEVFD